jgi:hypothetical protein
MNIGNPVSALDTPIKVINQMFRLGGAHPYAWDFETLSHELAGAGFTDIGRWSSGQSSRPELCLDDPSHAPETLYVEAEKPRGLPICTGCDAAIERAVASFASTPER